MKISKLSIAPVYLAVANATAVYADAGEFLPDDPASGQTLPGLIKTLLNFAIGFAVVVCVAILIFAGYSFMTANGDENKIKKATQSLTWAIIGLVICFVATLLVRFVGERIGISFGV